MIKIMALISHLKSLISSRIAGNKVYHFIELIGAPIDTVLLNRIKEIIFELEGATTSEANGSHVFK